jgi:pimeloyl-ACP methyl ester carboxylesterase
MSISPNPDPGLVDRGPSVADRGFSSATVAESALPALPLPDGIRSRQIESVNGLSMHVLEAGDPTPGHPLIVLLHGFPELAYSWRKIMPALARAGYYVVAPDQRGYGRTLGWDNRYDGDLASFRMPNLVKDVLALVAALGHAEVRAVVGHDFGSPVAGWCALLHPEVFKSVVLMSAPFGGAPGPAPSDDIHQALLAQTPPRKHYQWYYSTPDANTDMLHAAQGLKDFLRAYYYVKSGDFAGPLPQPLQGWNAAQLATLPTYYVMLADQTMAQTVLPSSPDAQYSSHCEWLRESELEVYCAEFSRVGFQGGLHWYRCATESAFVDELRAFRGRSIEVPACYIAGANDWGVVQKPGELARMQSLGCRDFRGSFLVPGAGHWVQQEQASSVIQHLLSFLEPSQ